MTYRTTLTDPKGTGDRPKQAFHMTTAQAYDWARLILAASSPEAYVTLYAQVEVECYVYRPATGAPGAPLEPIK